MDTAKRFFQKYFLYSIFIILFFLVINVIFAFGAVAFMSKDLKHSDISVSTIAKGIQETNGTITVNNDVTSILSKKNCWAMLLNDSGTILWEHALPDKLKKQYTSSDIAQFSRWYLDKYPVVVETSKYGLLVVGYPPDSLIKLNYITSASALNWLTSRLIIAVILNVLLVIGLLCRNIRKVEKATSPIMNGIKDISLGNPVTLPEKGELAEINAALNTMEKHLNNKEKARSEWINGVSHDVRTPLSIMLGYASEMEENEQLPETIREQGKIIRAQGEKLRNLIADLNLTSKLEYSMQPLNLGKIDFIELIRQVILEFYNNNLTDTFDINLENNLTSDMLSIEGDSSLLTRMLRNLIQNSIFHNPDGCAITVSIQNSEKEIELNIMDNGMGISNEQLEQFNHAVFSSQNYMENGETAHGFGLKLVCQIVHSHHGMIHFAHNEPTGLCVKIKLPN